MAQDIYFFNLNSALLNSILHLMDFTAFKGGLHWVLASLFSSVATVKIKTWHVGVPIIAQWE